MKKQLLVLTLALGATLSAKSQNPYLPMWEYIPDAEPYVFEDPDHPGRQRVYIYGSHDSMVSEYCGRELVTWSAPVDSLDRWRYEGVIFEVKRNARGEYLDGQQRGDVLYAPDVVETTDEAGRRCYYLYPNNQSGGRKGMVAKSYRPDGPFEVINWDPASPSKTIGVLGFDPAVFRDDDGRVYGYWGFGEPYVAELDPTTMATVKPGTQVLHNYINGYKQPGIFRFFEASSIRKVKDKYILIYSRMTGQNEFGLPTSNYTLAYAYSSSPMGPFTYGGTIIDGRGRDLDAQGTPVFTATPNGNTHGSICEVNGRWWVFYHRQTGLDEYSRQAMVAPIEVEVEEGEFGKVRISEGAYTSEGFLTDGLPPLRRYSAGIACYYTGPKPAEHHWPRKTFHGSYVAPRRLPDDCPAMAKGCPPELAYALDVNHNPVVNNTDGSVVGYKYFNFSQTRGMSGLALSLRLIPQGLDATIDIMLDSPRSETGGRLLGSMTLTKEMPCRSTLLEASLPALTAIGGKHALFLCFRSQQPGQSVCELLDLAFIPR